MQAADDDERPAYRRSNQSCPGAETAAAVIDSNRPVARRIEELFLVCLSRKPRPQEARRLLDYAAARECRQAASRHPLVAAQQH